VNTTQITGLLRGAGNGPTSTPNIVITAPTPGLDHFPGPRTGPDGGNGAGTPRSRGDITSVRFYSDTLSQGNFAQLQADTTLGTINLVLGKRALLTVLLVDAAGNFRAAFYQPTDSGSKRSPVA